MKIQSNASDILQVGNIHGRRRFQQFKRKRQPPISAKNNWGITGPEEKRWVAQHLAESPEWWDSSRTFHSHRHHVQVAEIHRRERHGIIATVAIIHEGAGRATLYEASFLTGVANVCF